jgi:hypothetical protein
VRAAGAEIGDAGEAGLVAHLAAGAALQRLEALLRAAAEGVEAEAGDDGRGDLEGRQLAVGLEERLAALVGLADHDGAAVGRRVEQRFLELLLDQVALLLDDQDLALAGGEGGGALGLQRPDHADLVDGEAERLGLRVGDAQLVERLAYVEIGLADGDDAEAGVGASEHQPVELVGAPVGQRRGLLHRDDAALLAQPVVGPADVHAVGRQDEIGGGMDFDPVRVDVDGGRAVDRLAQDLEGDPQARVARHREGMQAPVEIFLDAGRVDDRHAGRHEGRLALMGDGRGFRHVVVAREGHDAAVFRGAGIVGVLEHVARAVDAGALAVPHAEHAIVARAGVEVDLLGAPQSGGGQVLVGAGLELDVALLDEFLGLPQGLVEAAQRRAAIAGNVAAGVQAGREVALTLHHREAHQRLRPGQVNASALQYVFVVEGHREGHGKLPDISIWGR